MMRIYMMKKWPQGQIVKICLQNIHLQITHLLIFTLCFLNRLINKEMRTFRGNRW